MDAKDEYFSQPTSEQDCPSRRKYWRKYRCKYRCKYRDKYRHADQGCFYNNPLLEKRFSVPTYQATNDFWSVNDAPR